MTGPEGSTGCGHRVLPHTADVIVQAWAPTPWACVAEAVLALTESFATAAPGAVRHCHRFDLEPGEAAAVLVAALEEALFLLDARGEVPVAARLADEDGVVRGVFEVVGAQDVQVVGSVPKGVSWSGLAFERRGHGWCCTATIDV